jgi:hypothetical protein
MTCVWSGYSFLRSLEPERGVGTAFQDVEVTVVYHMVFGNVSGEGIAFQATFSPH